MTDEPLPTSPVEAAELVPGLTNPRALSFERFPIHTRESSATLSAWRLALAAQEGEGAIVLVEIAPDRPLYRGDGILLGWTQQRLEAAYRALLPRPEGTLLEMQQLG